MEISKIINPRWLKKSGNLGSIGRIPSQGLILKMKTYIYRKIYTDDEIHDIVASNSLKQKPHEECNEWRDAVRNEIETQARGRSGKILEYERMVFIYLLGHLFNYYLTIQFFRFHDHLTLRISTWCSRHVSGYCSAVTALQCLSQSLHTPCMCWLTQLLP